MFKIKKFEVCQVTGFVELEVEFSIYGSPSRTVKECYKTRTDANHRITEMKIDYLLFSIEKLIHECRELFELGITKSTPGRIQAFTKLKDGVHYLQDKDLKLIANVIIKLEPFLGYILPYEKQERYDFLSHQKLHLVNFSKEIINLQTSELCQV